MKIAAFIAIGLLNIMVSAQSEKENIQVTIEKYIKGTSYNNPEIILEAFYEEANLFLTHKEKKMWIVPIKEYTSWFEKKEKGTFNGRIGKILSIDSANDIATAKAEILIEGSNNRYIDLFLLKKIDGVWKIISKVATSKKLK